MTKLDGPVPEYFRIFEEVKQKYTPHFSDSSLYSEDEDNQLNLTAHPLSLSQVQISFCK